jgi:hypothetical protein
MDEIHENFEFGLEPILDGLERAPRGARARFLIRPAGADRDQHRTSCSMRASCIPRPRTS